MIDQFFELLASMWQQVAHCVDTLLLNASSTRVWQYLSSAVFQDVHAWSSATATAFALIVAAEIGDKSQLVCMALASKHRPLPVLAGAFTAFALLNAIAVIFGAAVAKWLPAHIIALAVAGLFTVFGIQALRTQAPDNEEQNQDKPGHNIFFGTFLLISVAEFGDKTQLAVVALSSSHHAFGIWLGASLALGLTSALGVLAGRKLVQKYPLELIHKISGIFFLGLAIAALASVYVNIPIQYRSALN